nr:surface carbohydrate biosynthesis protein [Neobacillus sp. Marseille-Q6967]
MSRKWLFIPVEIKLRELNAKLLLTYHALRRNYNVIIGEAHKIYENAAEFPKGILFSKGYTLNNMHRNFTAKETGHILVELDEEGLFEKESLILDLRTDEKLFSLIDHIYCWGKYHEGLLLKKFPQFKEKIFITGNPRFDLLRKKYRNLFGEEVKKIREQYKDFILVNTRFSFYNTHNGFNPKEEELRKLYDHFIILVRELSYKYPNLNFVVRPHPGESMDSYRRELDGCKNVFVVHSGNIIEWILASQLVIHNGCTTGIESFLVDKPVISYIPFESASIKEFLPDEISIKIPYISQIDSLIGYYISRRKSIPSYEMNYRKNVLFQYYPINGNYSYENILNHLDNIVIKKDGSIQETDFLKKLVEVKNPELIAPFANLIIEITEYEIRQFFLKLDEIEGKQTKFKIQNFNSGLFVITPSD